MEGDWRYGLGEPESCEGILLQTFFHGVLMKRALLVLGIVVLCLPMLFVTWLLLSVSWSRMDATTMKLPSGLRSAVAAVALDRPPFGPDKIDRVLRLDPDNAKAIGESCRWYSEKKSLQQKLDICRKAVSLEPISGNFYALGRAQEGTDDECTAEETFTRASRSNPDVDNYNDVEAMGIAALRCGHLYYARAGLEQASIVQEKVLKNSKDEDPEEIDDIKDDQKTDREYLILTYDGLHETQLKSQTCKLAHPDWQACDCRLDEDGKPACKEAKH